MTDNTKVLVTGDSVAPTFLAQLEDAGLTVVNPRESYPPAILSPEALVSELDGCRGYLLGGDEIATAEVLAKTSGLDIISFLGVGYQSFVDADAAAAAGIPVTNTPGVLDNSVAEFATGLLLEARRDIISYATDPDMEQQKASDLAGHPIGIVGLGAIGTRMAEILTLGFGAKVSYFSRTRKPIEEERLHLTYMDLDTLIDQVEALILMVPETPETTCMVNDTLLSHRLRPDPLTIVNIARAEVIDPEALAKAIVAGAVNRVTFDGYYRDTSEATSSLRALSGVRVTPHVASLTHDALDAMAQLAVDAILKVIAGSTPDHIVNNQYAAHRAH